MKKFNVGVSGWTSIDVEAKTAEEAEQKIKDFLSGDLEEEEMLELDQEKLLILGDLYDWNIENVMEL